MQTDRELDLLGLYRSLMEERWVIVGITGAAAVISVVTALVMTPVYRAEVVVSEVEEQRAPAGAAALLGQFGGLAGMAGLDISGLGTKRGQAKAVLQSRMIVEEFIRRNELRQVLYPERSPESLPSLWIATDDFVNYTRTVREDPRTGLLVVSIEWTDPVAAAEWANGLVALANELLRERDRADAERSIAYLREQLKDNSVVELQQVLYRLIEKEMQTLVLANARAEYAFSTIDPANPPESRIRPRRTIITVLGTFVGGLLALLVAGLRQTIKKQKQRAIKQFN